MAQRHLVPLPVAELLHGAREEPILGREEGDGIGGGGGMHAGEVIENLVPVYAGDVLTAKTALKDVYAKTGRTGTMVFVVWKTSFTNQRGEKVADVQESFMRRAT